MNIDIQGLREFLLKNRDYFQHKYASINTCAELERFKIREAFNIVFPGEYFLCDIYSNEMWIVRLLPPGKYFRLKTGRRVECEPVAMVVDNCQDLFSTFGGCWKIPERFILPIIK